MFKDGIYDFFFQILWLSKFFHSETKKKKKKTEKKQHNVAIEPRHYDQPVKQVKKVKHSAKWLVKSILGS